MLEFWLTDGRAPRAQDVVLTALRFDPTSLEPTLIQEGWFVRDSRRVLFVGTSRTEALQAIDILKRYEFNAMASVGAGPAAMTLFLGGHGVGPAGVGLPPPLHFQRLTPPRLADQQVPPGRTVANSGVRSRPRMYRGS